MVQLKQVSWYITATSVKYSGNRYLQYIVIYFRIKHKKKCILLQKGTNNVQNSGIKISYLIWQYTRDYSLIKYKAKISIPLSSKRKGGNFILFDLINI